MIGGWEIIVILFVILVLFGGKKLPEFAKNLGQGIHEFKKAANGLTETEEVKSQDSTVAKATKLDPKSDDISNSKEV